MSKAEFINCKSENFDLMKEKKLESWKRRGSITALPGVYV